jgi:hypothetical protein
MKKVILFCLALFATSAFATERPQTSGDATAVAGASSVAVAGAVASAGVNARISNDIRNNASAWQAQMQQQRQQQATSVNTGNNSLTVNEAAIPAVTQQYVHQDSYTVKTVPNVFSGNVYPTAPCMGSSTVGGAGVGFGFSIGSSWTDDECGIRETSRSFNALGLKDDAVRVLCTSKYAATAVACKEK